MWKGSEPKTPAHDAEPAQPAPYGPPNALCRRTLARGRVTFPQGLAKELESDLVGDVCAQKIPASLPKTFRLSLHPGLHPRGGRGDGEDGSGGPFCRVKAECILPLCFGNKLRRHGGRTPDNLIR